MDSTTVELSAGICPSTGTKATGEHARLVSAADNPSQNDDVDVGYWMVYCATVERSTAVRWPRKGVVGVGKDGGGGNGRVRASGGAASS